MSSATRAGAGAGSGAAAGPTGGPSSGHTPTEERFPDGRTPAVRAGDSTDVIEVDSVDDAETPMGPGDVTDEPDTTVSGGGKPFGTVAVALAIVVGLLLGYAAGLLTPSLIRPGDSSPEAGFARDMSTHHAQAVEMAMLAHQRAADPDVVNLGADIALTQQAQIGMMQTWLREWHLEPTGSQPRMAWMADMGSSPVPMRDGLMPGMATDAERAQLRTATGQDFDVLFLRLMRDHHIGGIHMAEAVLELSDDDEVERLAQSMVDGQKKEIALIGSLLGKFGAA